MKVAVALLLLNVLAFASAFKLKNFYYAGSTPWVVENSPNEVTSYKFAMVKAFSTEFELLAGTDGNQKIASKFGQGKKCMVVEPDTTKDKTDVMSIKCDNTATQNQMQWKLESAADNSFLIIHASSGYCMQAQGDYVSVNKRCDKDNGAMLWYKD